MDLIPLPLAIFLIIVLWAAVLVIFGIPIWKPKLDDWTAKRRHIRRERRREANNRAELARRVSYLNSADGTASTLSITNITNSI